MFHFKDDSLVWNLSRMLDFGEFGICHAECFFCYVVGKEDVWNLSRIGFSMVLVDEEFCAIGV